MAGIRKKLKAIKKRLRRMVSKTPKRKFYYGFFSKILPSASQVGAD